jgi:hypothetical protein
MTTRILLIGEFRIEVESEVHFVDRRCVYEDGRAVLRQVKVCLSEDEAMAWVERHRA